MQGTGPGGNVKNQTNCDDAAKALAEHKEQEKKRAQYLEFYKGHIMAEFFLEYGLFLAKTITLVVAFVAIVLVVVAVAGRKQPQGKDSILGQFHLAELIAADGQYQPGHISLTFVMYEGGTVRNSPLVLSGSITTALPGHLGLV